MYLDTEKSWQLLYISFLLICSWMIAFFHLSICRSILNFMLETQVKEGTWPGFQTLKVKHMAVLPMLQSGQTKTWMRWRGNHQSWAHLCVESWSMMHYLLIYFNKGSCRGAEIVLLKSLIHCDKKTIKEKRFNP